MVKSIFIKKGKVIRLVLSNIKVHYKATEIKVSWYLLAERQTNRPMGPKRELRDCK